MNLPKKPKVLLIIPAYNEEDNIQLTINKIKQNKEKYDYIIINDGSTDNTQKICEENNFNHINLIANLGIGGAVQTGYKYAFEHDYDIAVQFDGDGQHDVSYVKNLIKPLLKGKDIVIGSRFINKNYSDFKSTASRRFGIKILSFVIKFLTEKDIKDPTSGFRGVNKNIIKLFANSYPMEFPEPISFVELARKGYTFDEVPVKMYERIGGKSSIHSWKNVYYMINVIISMLVTSLRRYK
ncbi:MAG: glycosyltransferase family 2 protein [Bacilli bacterium]|nr:glycosyltransferase family 2 protein [Bacilli bacterium]MDD4706016.1 glycosyltransferase family 2 protein [Bacilli bacterium]